MRLLGAIMILSRYDCPQSPQAYPCALKEQGYSVGGMGGLEAKVKELIDQVEV